MKLYRSFATVASYTIGSRVFGFMRTALMARYLGAGPMTDAITMALKLPTTLRRIFAEGAFNAVFIPMYTGILTHEGEHSAHKFAQEIYTVLLTSLVVVTIVSELFMPDVVRFLLSGFTDTPERMELTIEYTRVTFPFIVFISLCAFYSGILNAHDRFAAVSASPMIGNIALIAVFIGLLPYLSNTGMGIAVGTIAMGIVQYLWVWYPARKVSAPIVFTRPRYTPHVRKFMMRIGPAIAGGGVVQINTLVCAAIASYLPSGGVSYLEYAERLNQLPLSVVGTAVSTAMLPLLARQFRQHKLKEALQTQTEALELTLFLTLPAAIGLFFLAEPIVTVLFQRDAFTAAATYATMGTLELMSLGLPAYVLVKIFTTTYFANGDTRTPLYTGLLSVFTDIVVSLILLKPLAHLGLALATGIASWLNVVLLAVILYRRGQFAFTARFRVFLLRIMGVSAGTGFMLSLLRDMFSGWRDGHGFLYQAFVLSCFLAVGLATYFVLCHVTGTYNLTALRQKFKKVHPDESAITEE